MDTPRLADAAVTSWALGTFPLLAFVNTAVKTHVHVSTRFTLWGICLEVQPWTTGELAFKVLRNRWAGSTVSRPHRQCVRVPMSLQPGQHVSPTALFITATLVGMQSHLIVGLVCIFLMTNDGSIFCIKQL